MSKYHGLAFIDDGQEVYEAVAGDKSGRKQRILDDDDDEPPENETAAPPNPAIIESLSVLSVAERTRRLAASQSRARPFFIDSETLEWVNTEAERTSDLPDKVFGEDALFPPRERREGESAQTRFRRLRRELDELETDLASPLPRKTPEDGLASSGPSISESMLSELARMKTRMVSLDPTTTLTTALQEGDARLRALQDLPVTEAKTATAPVATYSSLLDQRLGALEKAVGISEYSVHQGRLESQVPLASSLAALRVQLAALSSPRHLESITRRLKLTLAELEKVNAARRRFGAKDSELKGDFKGVVGRGEISSSQLKQLDQLAALLPQLESLMPLMQPILNTIQSSRSLHARASQVDTNLERLERLASEMQDLNSTISENCQRLELSMEENEARMRKNLEAMSARMKSLDLDQGV